MKKHYKKFYVLLVIAMLLFVTAYSLLNIFLYGSVIQINVPVLSFIIIIPIYLAFKNKVYSKRMLILLSSLLMISVVWTFFLIPKYTYDEALLMISKEDKPLEIQVKRRTGTKNFFYSGDYYIETENHKYTFNFKTGVYKIID